MWIRHNPAVPEPEPEELSGDEDGVIRVEYLRYGFLSFGRFGVEKLSD